MSLYSHDRFGVDKMVPNPQSAQALAGAIVAAKRTPDAPRREQYSGRLDRTRLARLAVGDKRVFTRPGAAAPQRLHVAILLDASGSMTSSGKIPRTLQMAMDLAAATDRLPNVTAEIWLHTEWYETALMRKLWASGEPYAQLRLYAHVPHSGNYDGYAIQYVADELKSQRRPGVQELIIVVSDGEPAEDSVCRAGHHDMGKEHVAGVVMALRHENVGVISVSIDHALSARAQHEMYGREYTIEYSDSTRATALAMARAIGQALG